MNWNIDDGDILNIGADALIYSANVQLNMSGGVGGAILVRYGSQMQDELRRYLSDNGIFTVLPGTVVETSSCGTPFRFVLHAVAVDAFYDTSHELLVSTLRRALTRCAENGAESVALTALATGFGRYPLEKFALVLHELRADAFDPIKTVTICLRNKADAEELTESLDFLAPASASLG